MKEKWEEGWKAKGTGKGSRKVGRERNWDRRELGREDYWEGKENVKGIGGGLKGNWE